MVHKWELIFGEFFWPSVGFYLGNKVHWTIAIILMVVGQFFAEYLMYYAITHKLVVP